MRGIFAALIIYRVPRELIIGDFWGMGGIRGFEGKGGLMGLKELGRLGGI